MKLILTLVVLAFASVLHAEEITLKAESDTYVKWKSPHQLHGTDRVIITGNDGYALVNFSASKIPKGSVVTDVKVVFTSTESIPLEKVIMKSAEWPSHYLAAASIFDGWREDKPAWPPSDQATMPAEFDIAERQVTFKNGGLIQLFQGMVNGTYTAGFMYKAINTFEGVENFKFSSREGNNPPYAVVTYTPPKVEEPEHSPSPLRTTAWVLGGLVLIALVVFRKRIFY